MTEQVDDQTLRSMVAATVLSCAGVARLEPSLKSALLGLAAQRRRDGDDPSRSVEGITLTSSDLVTDVGIDLAVEAPSQALATAATVQEQVRDLLRSLGREPGEVTVTVLALA